MRKIIICIVYKVYLENFRIKLMKRAKLKIKRLLFIKQTLHRIRNLIQSKIIFIIFFNFTNYKIRPYLYWRDRIWVILRASYEYRIISSFRQTGFHFFFIFYYFFNITFFRLNILIYFYLMFLNFFILPLWKLSFSIWIVGN